MRLFLSGGGDKDKTVLLDKKFAESLDKSKPLLYIPIAINKIKHPYPECLKWAKSVFVPLGIKNIELWTEEDIKNRDEKDLWKFSGVYIGGGNTFYLLNELKNSGFMDKLIKLILHDIPFYGGSAGAIIFGKTILTSPDENKINLKDCAGFNIIGDYSIFCHYDKPEEKKWVKITVSKIKKTIALPENCGLYLKDKTMEIIGPGLAYLPDEKKTLAPGEKINVR